MLNKVLCIEDSRIMQNIYQRLIRGAGVAERIDSVYSGREAIRYYQELLSLPDEGKPDYPELILLDLNMPVMGGWDFLEELSELYDALPVKPVIVIVTTSVDPEDRRRAERHPRILDLVSKPLTLDSLKSLAERLDGGRKNGM